MLRFHIVNGLLILTIMACWAVVVTFLFVIPQARLEQIISATAPVDTPWETVVKYEE